MEESVKNAEIREKLLSNPKTAVEELIDVLIPENFEVAVHQDTPEKNNKLITKEIQNVSKRSEARIRQ